MDKNCPQRYMVRTCSHDRSPVALAHVVARCRRAVVVEPEGVPCFMTGSIGHVLGVVVEAVSEYQHQLAEVTCRTVWGQEACMSL